MCQISRPKDEHGKRYSESTNLCDCEPFTTANFDTLLRAENLLFEDEIFSTRSPLC